MCARNTYITIWLVVAVLLFFCFFGRTDAEGFHVGWLVATRPGWLWFTILSYIYIIAVAFVHRFNPQCVRRTKAALGRDVMGRPPSEVGRKEALRIKLTRAEPLRGLGRIVCRRSFFPMGIEEGSYNVDCLKRRASAPPKRGPEDPHEGHREAMIPAGKVPTGPNWEVPVPYLTKETGRDCPPIDGL